MHWEEMNGDEKEKGILLFLMTIVVLCNGKDIDKVVMVKDKDD